MIPARWTTSWSRCRSRSSTVRRTATRLSCTSARTLNTTYDLVFIDGDKREYPAYYNMLMDKGLVHSGSIMLADNILWYGKVVQPVAHNDRHTEALIEFNRMVVEDDRVESVILPLRDGINIIRVK